MSVGISLSAFLFPICRSGGEMGSNRLMIRMRRRHSTDNPRKGRPELRRMARRYCSLGRYLAKSLSAFCDGNLAAIKLQHKQPQRRRKIAVLAL
jgi:hypothetical protein